MQFKIQYIHVLHYVLSNFITMLKGYFSPLYSNGQRVHLMPENHAFQPCTVMTVNYTINSSQHLMKIMNFIAQGHLI